MSKQASICYVVPYFGKLPSGFKMWLLSCSTNNTIDWILYTDDRTAYEYPDNVKVHYCSYEDIKNKIQKCYEFKISISRPWKLCDFRPAYGEIFAEDLKKYDFWGHCDMDLIWGDIRKFITEDILMRYDKIGFQGHSTLYRNTQEVNSRYRIHVDGIVDYKEAFTSDDGQFFDEVVMTNLYKALNIPQYTGTNFAHLDRFTTSFYLLYLPEEDGYKNNRQVFTWESGKIIRNYLDGTNVKREEYMYIHLFSRPISFKVKSYSKNTIYTIYPDLVKELGESKLDYRFINKHGTCSTVHFYAKVAWFYRKKITAKKIIFYLRKKTRLAVKRGFN
ncbi:DUF6625 family protein [Faecalibacterium sp. An192]|uniref:DUF6625 family protein n=1 Tax=Faecalibacterium sp. An192 TaxID=1965581 RepID=UPI000B397A25|nr:DUF6625 family protein [Faecalibacterium sp. An192]OUP28188.1 hypothetical protein B5F27_07755 [Faecalibacterium sp. An192]